MRILLINYQNAQNVYMHPHFFEIVEVHMRTLRTLVINA